MKWQLLSNDINLEVHPSVMIIGKGVQGRQPSERYLHPGLWSVHLYPYEGELTVAGRHFPIRPGYASVVPPGVAIEYHVAKPSAHFYAHFTVSAGRDPVPIRTMQDTGDRFGRLWEDFEEAIHYRWDNPVRVSARVWDILWELALLDRQPMPYEDEIAFGRITKSEAVVTAAIQLIESHLSENLSVSRLASWLNISRNHLTRLFKEATSETVVGYIQKRRIDHARLLLSYTDRPIGVIAAEVGIPDAQHFNKTIRHFLGESPSQIRIKARPLSSQPNADTANGNDL